MISFTTKVFKFKNCFSIKIYIRRQSFLSQDLYSVAVVQSYLFFLKSIQAAKMPLSEDLYLAMVVYSYLFRLKSIRVFKMPLSSFIFSPGHLFLSLPLNVFQFSKHLYLDLFSATVVQWYLFCFKVFQYWKCLSQDLYSTVVV